MANSKNSEFNRYRDDLFCSYCHRQCKSLNSLKQHETRCVKNPGMNKHACGFKIAYDRGWDPSWNRGLTKETDSRVLNNSNKIKEYYNTHDGTFLGKHHTEESKARISMTMIKKGYGGICKRKLIEYKGTVLESTYEYVVAVSLDENNIKWVKTSRKDFKFPYSDPDGVTHYYTPDFYLPDYNMYLDPKNDYLISKVNPKFGYRDIDKIKWAEQQNGIRVLVLDKDNLTWDKISQLI